MIYCSKGDCVMTEYFYTIKSMPESMRPREKLLAQGEAFLSDVEMLAIIIGHGTHKLSALDLGQALIARFGSLRSLKEASIEELIAVKGIGKAKAISIKAALELGRRLSLDMRNKIKICSPEDVKSVVMEDMRYYDREHFRVMYLNRKNSLIIMEDVSIGGLHSSVVHPREVFKTAIKRSAASMILIHNHPSGDPTPSQDDIEVTKRLIESGKLIGIEVIDHIIIGENEFYSMKREQLI